jgi:hypothetical protein
LLFKVGIPSFDSPSASVSSVPGTRGKNARLEQSGSGGGLQQDLKGLCYLSSFYSEGREDVDRKRKKK